MKRTIFIFLFLALASVSTFAQTSIQGREVHVRAFGAKCDNSTNDTAAIQAAITAVTATGGVVNLPDGICVVTGLTVPGGVTLKGKGKYVSVIKSSANGVILDLVQGSGAFAFLGPKVQDLWVDGSDSGSSQIGIQVTDATAVRDVNIEDVTISDCGSHGLSRGNVFSSQFKNIYSYSNGGYNFFINSPNMPSNYDYGHYSGDISSASPAGYRIKQGTFNCWSCNGINVNAGATGYWAVIGGKSGDIDGDASAFYANARFVDCNIEGAKTAGVLNYPGSVPSFEGETTFVGLGASSGSWKAIDYDTDASLFPQNSQRGYIWDTVVFSNSPITFYANSQPIHADGNPPVSLNGQGVRVAGVGVLNTYYNSANARAEQLNRADGSMGVVSVTATTSFPNPGLRYLEVTCATDCTQTLPSASFYTTSDPVTIKNLSTTGVVVTIAANSGSSVNGSSYALSTQGNSVTLIPNSLIDDWRIVAANVSSVTVGTGVSPRLTHWASTTTITSTSGLEYEAGSQAVKSPARYWGAATSSGAPTFSFTSDSDTGIYNPSANAIGFAGGGASLGSLASTGLTLGIPGTTAGALILGSTSNSNTTSIISGAPASSISLTLPATLPASAGCLQVSSTGVITQTGSACGSGGGGTPGGSTTQLQYNNVGAFGGITGATTNGTFVTLTSPVFIAPALGTPSSGVATNLTGLPLTTGVTGTLPVANGGTGATTLTGVLIGTGTTAVTVKTNPSGAFVGDTDTQTLSGKTLTTPTIAATGWSNANHDHSVTNAGGQLNASTVFSAGSVPMDRGGTNAAAANFATNGAVYYNGTRLLSTATGGSGTLCLTSTDGGAPLFGSCTGSASTVWSALTAPSGALSLSMAAFNTAFTWGATTSGNMFTLRDTSSNVGTGYVLLVNTAASSAAKPISITAGGTVDGVEMSTAGVLQKIGTGTIIATSGDSATSFFSAGQIEVARGGTGADLSATGGTSQYLKQSSSGAVITVGTIAAADLPSSFSGLGNPTASVGLTAVNGSATTAMRSDGAPALSQAIVPTWTGLHTFNLGTTPTDAVILDIAAIGSAGTRDSHNLVFNGRSNNGSAHTVIWKQFIDVTTNAGASAWVLRSNLDGGSFSDWLTVADNGDVSLGNIIGSSATFGSSVSADTLSATTSLAVTGTSTMREIDPQTDNTYDLGTTSLRWKTVHVGPGSLVVHNDATNTLKATLGFSGSTAQLTTDAATPLQLRTGANNGVFLNTNGTIGFNLATATNGNFDFRQIANGDQVLNIRRFTDTSPTGNFINFENAAGTDLFTVDVTGSLTAGTIPAARISSGTIGATNGGTGLDTSGSTGMPLITGGTWSVISTTGTGNAVRATSPNVTGATLSAVTSFGIRSTGTGAFDLRLANSENLTTDRTLTLATGNTNSSLTVSGAVSVSGSNTGDQTITLTGDVTGSGTTGVAATISNGVVTYAKMSAIVTDSLIGRDTAGSGAPEAIAMGGSLVFSGSQTIQLSGDAASPGASQYYGTNASSVKGWYALSGGGGSGTVTHTAGALTANSFVFGNGADDIKATAAATNGQLLIGSTGVNPVAAALTGSSSVSVANGAGSITLSVPSSGITNAMLAGGITDDKLVELYANTASANTFSGLQTVSIEDSATTTATTLLDLIHNTTSAGGTNFGGRIRFGLETNTTANRDAAQVVASWSTATDASRTSQVLVQTVSSAAPLATTATFAANGDFTLAGSSAIAGAAIFNATTGFRIGGAAASGQYLRGNGTNFVSSSLQGSDMPATVVRTDQSNTYSTGSQDFTLASSFTLPVSAGASPTNNGTVAYDSTAGALEYGDGGTNRTVANLDEAQTFTNKTFSAASNVLGGVTMTLGSDATGDGYARNSSGVLARIPTYNVRSFGAACDGTTNDATAIQNAINAAITGGTISFEGCKATKVNSQLTVGNGSGTYSTGAGTTSTINDITIEGHGVKITWGGSTTGVFSVNGPVSRVKMRDIFIDMASASGIALDLNHPRMSEFSNVYIENNADYGVRIRAYGNATLGDGATSNILDNVVIASTTAGAKGFNIGYTDVCSGCTLDPAQNVFRNIRARFDTGPGTYVTGSIGINLNYTDASQFDNVITAAATGLQITVPSGTGGASYPAGIQFNNPALVGTSSVTVSGTWTVTDKIAFYNYQVADGQVVPTDTSNTYGFDSDGNSWGQGNIGIAGSGKRITADFSNATLTNRTMFQSSTANGSTFISTLPNGTDVFSGFVAYANASPTSSHYMRMFMNGSFNAFIDSGKNGGGAVAPIGFAHNGTQIATFTTGGHLAIGTSPPDAAFLTVQGGIATAVTSLSASTTMTDAHSTILCDASGAARTMTLPASSGLTGRQYTLKKTDSTVNACIFDGNASETIDGATTVNLVSQNETMTIQSDGTNWRIIQQMSATDLLTVNGRLTTQTAVPVSTSDRTAQSTIFFTPYAGSRVALYNGQSWRLFEFTERSLALSGLTSGKNYDVFLYDNAGVLTMELSAAWTTDTARADALTTQNGVLVKSGSTTRRYLGTIRTTGTTTTADTLQQRYVWNYYNRVERFGKGIDLTDTAYATNTERDYNGNTNTQVEWVVGVEEDIVALDAIARIGTTSDAAVNGVVYIRFDGTTDTTRLIQVFNSATTPTAIVASQSLTDIRYPGIGYHSAILRQITPTGSVTYYEAVLAVKIKG